MTFFPISLFTLTQSALADRRNKLDFGFGFYSLTGEGGTSAGSVSGIGDYRIQYRRSIHPKLDLGVGYSVMFSSIISGDSIYGIDVGATYFPLTRSGPFEIQNSGQTIQIVEIFRPYVSLSFNQRNIQSVQTTYSGFGVSAGAEYQLGVFSSLNFCVRYLTLSGSRESTAKVIDFIGGISLNF